MDKIGQPELCNCVAHLMLSSAEQPHGCSGVASTEQAMPQPGVVQIRLTSNLYPCVVRYSASNVVKLACTDIVLVLQFGSFWTNGQICSATSRLLVHDNIADAFYKQLKKRAESIKICDPMVEDSRMGPVVSQGQYDKIMGFIEVMPIYAAAQCAPSCIDC